MASKQVGAIIESGLTDWQIIQQDAHGHGTITLRGRWVHETKGRVELRLVQEDTGVAVNAALDWQSAATAADGTWSATLRAIPAGGLYRLETRYRSETVPAGEWSPRGDTRHFVGVGDLWVIAGQSNSAGYGRGPYHDPSELGLHLFRNSEQWALAAHPMNDSTDTQHPVNAELANSGHSPYLHFARVLKQTLGYPIGLIQTSLGGSPLIRWNPVANPAADLFANMLRCVRQNGGRVRGILWYQGESETGAQPTAESYGDQFVAAVGAWRTALQQPELPVLTVQLNRVYCPPDETGGRLWSLVREGQRQVPHRLPHTAVVPSGDLPMSDLVHISPAGNLLLGERLARAALGLVHGHADNYLAPDITHARRLEDGRKIELTFANVTSRLDHIEALARPFRVENEGGTVPVTQIGYPGNATVQLTLERPLQGRAVVHGGGGQDPQLMPFDMERFLPALAFYGVNVE